MLQINVPLRHLLNSKTPFISEQRSAINELNDWTHSFDWWGDGQVLVYFCFVWTFSFFYTDFDAGWILDVRPEEKKVAQLFVVYICCFCLPYYYTIFLFVLLIFQPCCNSFIIFLHPFDVGFCSFNGLFHFSLSWRQGFFVFTSKSFDLEKQTLSCYIFSWNSEIMLF